MPTQYSVHSCLVRRSPDSHHRSRPEHGWTDGELLPEMASGAPFLVRLGLVIAAFPHLHLRPSFACRRTTTSSGFAVAKPDQQTVALSLSGAEPLAHRTM